MYYFCIVVLDPFEKTWVKKWPFDFVSFMINHVIQFQMAKRDINIDRPRYDQSTYVGRAKYYFSTTNPLNLFNSTETLERSRDIVQAVR